MEHKTLDDLQGAARIVGTEIPIMSRRERLERWAMLVEREGQTLLTPLRRVEFLPEHERRELRADNSPLTVASKDPVLREEGLAGDRLGDGMGFFELASGEAHYLLCDCHYQGTMAAQRVAERIRTIARNG
jgi:hypothetical protein